MYKLKPILNQTTTINNTNIINDYFILYLFLHEGNENITLNFINAVFTYLNFETFNKIYIKPKKYFVIEILIILIYYKK